MKTESQTGLSATTKPQAVILAGGRSSRFGEDKALVQYGNTTMLQKLATSLEDAGFQITISTSYKEHLKFAYPIIWDKDPFRGPLYALGNILQTLKAPKVFLIACDTPLMNANLAHWLWQVSRGSDITILENELGQPSPLPGIYSRRVLSVIRAAIAKKQESLKNLLEGKLKIKTIALEDWRRIDSSGRSLKNVNTKKELKEMCAS